MSREVRGLVAWMGVRRGVRGPAAAAAAVAYAGYSSHSTPRSTLSTALVVSHPRFKREVVTHSGQFKHCWVLLRVRPCLSSVPPMDPIRIRGH